MFIHSRAEITALEFRIGSKTDFSIYVWSEQKRPAMQNRVQYSIHVSYVHSFLPKVLERRSTYSTAPPLGSLQYSNQRPLLKPRRHPRRRSLQINILNPRFPLARLPHQIPKILSRNLALPLNLNPLFPLLP